MIRFILRFLGLLLLAAAFAALVVDGTRAIAADAWSFSSLYASLGALNPDLATTVVARVPAVWRTTADTILRGSPTCVVLAIVGLLVFALTAQWRGARNDRTGWSA